MRYRIGVAAIAVVVSLGHVTAGPIQQRIGKAMVWVIAGGYEYPLVYSTNPFRGGNFDTRDVSVSQMPSGHYNVVVRLAHKPSLLAALSVFKGAYGAGFDWYNSPMDRISGIWRGTGLPWTSVPNEARHYVNLKNKVHSTSVEFYETAYTSERRDALGNVLAKAEYRVDLVGTWTLSSDNAAKADWSHLMTIGYPPAETEEALLELIQVTPVQSDSGDAGGGDHD